MAWRWRPWVLGFWSLIGFEYQNALGLLGGISLHLLARSVRADWYHILFITLPSNPIVQWSLTSTVLS